MHMLSSKESNSNAIFSGAHVAGHSPDKLNDNGRSPIQTNGASGSIDLGKRNQYEHQNSEKANEECPVSYCLCLVNRNGYVLASDSRSSYPLADGRWVAASDTCKKIFYLPKAKVGILSCGLNTIGLKNIGNYFVEWDTEVECFDDFCADIARKIMKYKLPAMINVCFVRAQKDSGMSVWYYDIDNCLLSGKRLNETCGVWEGGAFRLHRDVLRDQDGHYFANFTPDTPLDQMKILAEESVRTAVFFGRFDNRVNNTIGGATQTLCVDANGMVL